jgi:hypothetical protein
MNQIIAGLTYVSLKTPPFLVGPVLSPAPSYSNSFQTKPPDSERFRNAALI